MYAMLDYAVAEGFVTPQSRARWRNADSVTSVMQILAKEGLAGDDPMEFLDLPGRGPRITALSRMRE